MSNNLNFFRKNKLFVIGGTIAAGKSTLISKLGKNVVYEINENDAVQDLFLKGNYDGTVSKLLIEMYFLDKRITAYRETALKDQFTYLDRSLFESYVFAKYTIIDKKDRDFFKKYFYEKVDILVEEFGIPNFYLILKTNYEEFEKRIKKRERKEEISKFDENKIFFKKHISNYEKDIIKILQRYNINYEVINTSSMKINEVHQSSKKFFDSYTKPKMKSNNSIVIGGMIASGKSSLGKNIAEFFEAEFIDELDWDDPLTNLSLDKLYSENLVTPLTTQIFFLMNRIERYKKNETTKQLKIHDRSILEDLIFSEPVIKNDKEHLRFFENLLRKEINKLFIESGVPKLYIFLKVGWKNFRQRIINRGRSNEIHDFPKKEKYFKKIIDRYNNLFEKILLTYNMRYIIIDTDDKTKKTVFKESIKAIKKSIGNPNYETKEIEINYKKQK